MKPMLPTTLFFLGFLSLTSLPNSIALAQQAPTTVSPECQRDRAQLLRNMVQHAYLSLSQTLRSTTDQNHTRINEVIATLSNAQNVHGSFESVAPLVAEALRTYSAADEAQLPALDAHLSMVRLILRDMGNQVGSAMLEGFEAGRGLQITMRTYSGYTIPVQLAPSMYPHAGFASTGTIDGASTGVDYRNSKFSISYCQRVTEVDFSQMVPEIGSHVLFHAPTKDLVCSLLDLRTGTWSDTHMSYFFGAELEVFDSRVGYMVPLSRFTSENTEIPSCRTSS